VSILLKVEHISYTMGTQALPDIYTLALRLAALGQVCVHQAKHSCLWYNYYICTDFPLIWCVKVVQFSQFRSRKVSAYIRSTGSGMLKGYTHCFNEIYTLVPVHISHYCTLGGKIKVKSVLLFPYCTRFKGCRCAIFSNCAVFAQVCCIFPFDPIQYSLHHNSKQ